MDSYIGKLDRGRRRACSPALSDISELTILSRSPSPVSGYDTTIGSSSKSPAAKSDASPRLRRNDGRFVSRKRPRTPERSAQKYVSSVVAPDAPRKSRARRIEYDSEPLTPCPSPRKAYVVGEGGFGTLDALPREVRQMAYGYVLDVDTPVTVKTYCGTNTTQRERNACRNHDTSKFGILRVSKAVQLEASWVLYSQGSLHIEVNQAITQYLFGQTRNLRHLGKSQHKEKTAIWTVATRFRYITISLPDDTLRLCDPIVITRQLLEVVCLLSNAWQTNCDALMTTSTVKIDLGTLFHQMLPFNRESQADDMDDQLLVWMYTNNFPTEQELEQIPVECEQSLKKLAVAVGMHHGSSKWTIAATTELDEMDEGGAMAMLNFQMNCARNGVTFEHRS